MVLSALHSCIRELTFARTLVQPGSELGLWVRLCGHKRSGDVFGAFLLLRLLCNSVVSPLTFPRPTDKAARMKSYRHVVCARKLESSEESLWDLSVLHCAVLLLEYPLLWFSAYI